MEAIRIFNGEGNFSFDKLIELASPFLKLLSEGKPISLTGFNFCNELYVELAKRNEIKKIEDIDKAKKMELWRQSEKYSTDRKTRIKVSRSLYLIENL